MLNSLPEVLLVIFGPAILFFVSTIIFMVDHIYLACLWFAHMGWFFKTNANDSGTGKPQWEDVTLVSPFNYACAIGLLILFIIVLFSQYHCFPYYPYYQFSIVYVHLFLMRQI